MQTIDFATFSQVVIVMGRVMAAEIPEGSKSVVKQSVDFGEYGIKTVFSGIKDWYAPEVLVGKVLPYVINLEPKKIGELGFSEGMLVAATPVMEDGRRRAVLLEPDQKVEPGTRVA